MRGFHIARSLAPVLVLALGSLFASSSLVRGAEIADLVQSHGLVPVSPPRPAANFSLPQFSGQDRSLSDFSGEWVILTFWASWCGPCRAEMPSLETLHLSHADKGVVVLGVSVDQDGAAARSFLGEFRLTFPQMWDAQGQVGSLYQATAIPMSYLVDPGGQVVALSRGARDWSQLAGLMDALIELVPPRSGAAAVYAEALELPGVANPPSAELVLSDSSPQAGQEFYLDIHLRWAGRIDEYMPQSPKVHLPEGVIQKGVTASTNSRDGAQVVVYRVTLQIEEAGSFALDPVELRYQPRFAADVASARVQGPTVTVEAQTVAGLPPRTFAMVAGGVAATALAGLAVGLKWRAPKNLEPATDAKRLEAMVSRYQQARSRRLQGDGAGFCLEMIGLLEELSEPTESEAAEMASLQENLRFGGYVPPASELDRWQRKVGRRLDAMQQDPDIAAREALRLQDDEES